MEREGTGLVDVEAMARELGGRVAFTHDGRDTGVFAACIYQPSASAGSKTVARRDRPIGIYVLNALPMLAIPERLSVARLTTRLSERPRHLSLDGAGTFIVRGDELWSFVPLERLTDSLGEIIDASKSSVRDRSEVEADPDARRVLSWLLRKHFERYLVNFRDAGLCLEDASRGGRRAYFHGHDGKPRTLVYNTPSRTGVKRQVVKQRADDPKTWFENEGFGYDIVQFDGVWAVRIKPFYMFTGRDARTPLPSFSRTARATRRIKFDRNKSVDDDLTFWARFLSRGAPTLNIGQEHVDSLILEGAFLTLEVDEQGLVGENDEAQHRVPA
jgi:hypothetical protein